MSGNQGPPQGFPNQGGYPGYQNPQQGNQMMNQQGMQQQMQMQQQQV